jgi:hypothetical protein
LAPWNSVFARFFAKLRVQNVVNWLVKRGGVVVKSVAEAIANRPREACRLFVHVQIFENLMQIGKSHTPAEEVNSALAQVWAESTVTQSK